jgi:hypothetical protein
MVDVRTFYLLFGMVALNDVALGTEVTYEHKQHIRHHFQ